MGAVTRVAIPFWLLASALAAFPASARVDCAIALVTHIQVEGNRVIYLQQGAPWRGLGTLSDGGVKERYSALLAAQMAGRKVHIGYVHGTAIIAASAVLRRKRRPTYSLFEQLMAL